MGAMTRTAEGQLAGLLSSAVAGDEVAFRHLIAAYHEDMRRVAAYVAADQSVAEEATQAAWLIAWRKLGNVRDEAHLRPWLVSVAANEAKRLVRKRRRRAVVETVADVSGEPGGVDPATGIAALDLDAALARLDPDDRALLAMRYVVGFDSTELAAAIGISPSGTRSRLERLLRRLREDLSDG
jgi:RNA polymerase sigma-70 factor (ECF subfamily)